MMTATQVQEVLEAAPAHERVAIAVRLIAQAWLEDDEDQDDPLPALTADREALLEYLRTKRSL